MARRPAELDQRPGTRRFRMERCVGRGRFGEVWLATLRSPSGLETEVAVKILRDEVGRDLQAIRRIRDEGQLLARVRHPAVTQVLDLTRLDGRIGFVTEFVDGDDLERLARPPDPIPPRALVQAIGMVAAGLAAAWDTEGPAGPLRIVHRDIKPSNVRIGRHGQVKLLDFGLARLSPEGDDRPDSFGPQSVVVAGAVPYLSPERIGHRHSLPAGDVYALGCCLYEALAGARFHLDGSLAALSALCLAPRRHAAHLEARLAAAPMAEGIQELLTEMLHFDPDLRPAATEIALRCEALGERLPGRPLRRWCAERRWVTTALPGRLDGEVLTEEDVPLTDDGATTEVRGPRTVGGTRELPIGVPLVAALPPPPHPERGSPVAPRPRLRLPVVIAAGCGAVGLVGALFIALVGAAAAWIGLG